MYTSIFVEAGVPDDHVEAVQLAYKNIDLLCRAEASPVLTQRLSIDVPILPSGQVDSAFISRVSIEGDARACFLMARDLGAAGLNFCFGRSAFDRQAVMVSSARVQPGTMFGLTLHEAGHGMGLVAEHSGRHDTMSHFIGHCLNDCVMQPVNTIAEMDATAYKAVSNPATAGFCEPCVEDLRSN